MIIRSIQNYRLPDRRLVSLRVLYFMPDYQHLLNEFIYQTVDELPDLPRVHRFLNYWHHHIEAVIKEVSIANADDATVRWRHGSVTTMPH